MENNLTQKKCIKFDLNLVYYLLNALYGSCLLWNYNYRNNLHFDIDGS